MGLDMQRGMWSYESLAYHPRKRSMKYALKILSKAKRVVKGTSSTDRAIEKNMAKIVYVGENVYPPEAVAWIPDMCNEKGIPCVSVPQKVLRNYFGVSDSVAVLYLGRGTGRVYQTILAEFLAYRRNIL